MRKRLSHTTRRVISDVFERLDYKQLESVYCYEGGDEFWKAKREPCRRLGTKVAEALVKKLSRDGRSLYVGAGVTELPALLAEVHDRDRQVEPYNLRRAEVIVLNRACRTTPVKFKAQDASSAQGRFDHLWMVSVLNDPERFPHDFVFRLTAKERLEVVTNCDHLARLKFSSTLPMAFTEHGAIMAATVLNSPQAVSMSVFVVRAFIQMREQIAANRTILKRLAEIDKTLLGHDTALVDLYEKLLPLLQPADTPKRRIGFQSKGKS